MRAPRIQDPVSALFKPRIQEPEIELDITVLPAGIVLAKEGGAVGKMLPVFNLFAGGPLGTGQQWCSWIHR